MKLLAALMLGVAGFAVQAQPLSDDAEHWRALSRFGYGPAAAAPAAATPDDAAAGRAWALRQLAVAHEASRRPAAIPPAFSAFAGPLPDLFAGQREERAQRRLNGGQPGQGFGVDMTRQAVAWSLTSCSRPDIENPLLARMTEFWFNHLNVFVGKAAVRPFTGHYAVHAIRPHALGRYEDLLLASARHPAMLLYLDQSQSVADGTPAPPSNAAANGRRGLNENYARELLELHTLGVDGGYSQTDVRELARILTGWTVDPRSPDGFRFVARAHDKQPKVLLGQRFEAGGLVDGEAAIRMLARHPSTARRIGLRLAQWFVSDQPPAGLVQRLAQAYEASQGDLLVVMRTLIESPETWAAQSQLFKTPRDYACSVLAAVGGPQSERELGQAQGYLASAGQPVYGWQTPDGYKTDAATWLSPEALSRRADFAFFIGRRVERPQDLQRWLDTRTRDRIAREPTELQAGLALASPGFMYK